MDRGIYPEEVGKYTYGHEHIKVKDFEGGEKLKIGKFCSIADKVTVFLGGNHKTERITTYPFESMWKEYFDLPPETHLNLKNTIIGNDVWIGHGVTIMSGGRRKKKGKTLSFLQSAMKKFKRIVKKTKSYKASKRL